MEEKTDSKRKTAPSIPANYISILQLQERWINEKERKQKEEEDEEIQRKQQDEEQQWIEEDLKKPEVKGRRDYRNHRMRWKKNSKEKKFVDGGEARCFEKEETAAIGNERGEDAVPRDEGSPKRKRIHRKRYNSRKNKKKNQDVAVEEDVVVCGSIASLPEYIATENNTPVKDEIRVFRKNGKEKKSVDSGETRCPEKEKPAAIGKEIGEDAAPRDEGLPEWKKKFKKQYKKKMNQDVAIKEDVVFCGFITQLPEYIVTENNKEKKSVDGREARCPEKEEQAAIEKERGENAAIEKERGENAAPRDEGLPEKKKKFKKRYKKKKNQDVAMEEDVVVCPSIEPLPEYIMTEKNTPGKDEIRVYAVPRDDGLREKKKKFKKQWKKKTNQDVAIEEDAVVCESIRPLPSEYIVTENKTPVKDEIRVYRKKGGKPKGKKSVEYREKAVKDATFIQKQFEDLSIKVAEEKGEAKNLKAQTRSSNQWYDLPPRSVRMPIGDAAMVWVKRGGDGI